MGSPDSNSKANHLCVLVHGLWGNPSHLSYIENGLRKKYPKDELVILNAKSNSGFFTYDGIELGGERLTYEIELTLEDLEKTNHSLEKLSIVGYSLGGLVARYAVGLLYSKGIFENIQPINFTTFATPHLGVRTPYLGFHHNLWNTLGSRTVSISGQQLYIIDSFRDTGRPLLSILADPGSIFIRGLSCFKNRSLYSNITNDRSAVFYTTAISPTDPFTDLDKIKIEYVEGYDPVILNLEISLSPKDNPETPNLYTRLATASQTHAKWLPLYAVLTFAIPIGAFAFLVNAGIQSVRSSQRIKLHEEGKAGIMIQPYRIPLIIDGIKGGVEKALGDISFSNNEAILPESTERNKRSITPFKGVDTTAPTPASPAESKIAHEQSSHERDQDQLSSSSTSLHSTSDQDQYLSKSSDSQYLALAPEQFSMIESLNNVGFQKFGVYIHNVRHSHAAIIVRMKHRGFEEEGEIVRRHWLEEVFEI
ncbi:MAG: hypothetical protein M1829_005798 [Trizodia sp. TS-e1964]|nr:MAG: hypothetical protein M1829_005798 [Trizodia sp. TS-e1964]